MARGRPDQALQVFEQARRASPGVFEVHFGLARARQALGDASGAVDAFFMGQATEVPLAWERSAVRTSVRPVGRTRYLADTVLTCDESGSVHAPGALDVEHGRVAWVGAGAEAPVIDGIEVRDLGGLDASR